jgi:hypothetical protein
VSSNAAEISMLARIPARKEPDTSAPNTATAIAPPVCLLALNKRRERENRDHERDQGRRRGETIGAPAYHPERQRRQRRAG